MKLRQQVSTPWKLINENGCCWDAVHALMCTFCGHTNFTTTIWRHSELTDAFQWATHSLPKSSVRLSHLQPFLMPRLHQEAHFATLPAAIHQMIGPVATRNNPFYATRDASTKEDELLRSDFARESERIMREAAQTATALLHMSHACMGDIWIISVPKQENSDWQNANNLQSGTDWWVVENDWNF
jgi:hypothetical protein